MNGEEVKNKILGNMKQRGAAAGWLPCSTIRTYEQYLQQVINQGNPYFASFMKYISILEGLKKIKSLDMQAQWV